MLQKVSRRIRNGEGGLSQCITSGTVQYTAKQVEYEDRKGLGI